MEHSAEWYRGAVAVARDVGEPLAVAHYTLLLAAAEAREAALDRAEALHDSYPHEAQPSAAEVIRVAKEALEETEAGAWDGHFGKGLSLKYAKLVSEARKKAFKAIAAWEAGNGQ